MALGNVHGVNGGDGVDGVDGVGGFDGVDGSGVDGVDCGGVDAIVALAGNVEPGLQVCGSPCHHRGGAQDSGNKKRKHSSCGKFCMKIPHSHKEIFIFLRISFAFLRISFEGN